MKKQENQTDDQNQEEIDDTRYTINLDSKPTSRDISRRNTMNQQKVEPSQQQSASAEQASDQKPELTNIKEVKEKSTKFIINALQKQPGNFAVESALMRAQDAVYGSFDKKLIGVGAENDVLTKHTTKDLLKLANQYSVLLDAERGIVTTETEKSGVPKLNTLGEKEEEIVVIRDARKQDAEKVSSPTHHKAAWHQMMLGVTAGATSLADVATNLVDSQKQIVQEELAKKWDKYRAKIDDLPEGANIDKEAAKIAKNFNYEIAKFIEDCEIKIPGKNKPLKGTTSIAKKVGEYRDFNNLKEDPKSVMTIAKAVDIKNKDGEVLDQAVTVMMEVRIHPLSPKHKEQYEAIRKFKEAEYSKSTKKEYETDPRYQGQLPDWFQKMPEYRQKLLMDNIDGIIDGKTISSQIRDIPGLRNAYVQEKVTLLKSDLDAMKPEDLQQMFQQKSELSISSATPAHIKGSKKIQEEISDQNVAHLKSLGGNDYDVKGLCLNQKLGAQATIANNYKKAADKNGLNYTRIEASVNDYGSSALGKVDRANGIANEYKESAKSQTGSSELHANGKPTLEAVSCQSGKDRAGTYGREIAWIDSTNGKIEDLIKTKYPNASVDQKDVQQAIINSGHCEDLAGRGGGAPGMKVGTILAGLGTKFIDKVKSLLPSWLGGIKKEDLKNQHYIADHADKLKSNIAKFNKIADNLEKPKTQKKSAEQAISQQKPKPKEVQQQKPKQKQQLQSAINLENNPQIIDAGLQLLQSQTVHKVGGNPRPINQSQEKIDEKKQQQQQQPQ